ncbi:MAG: nitroreductase family protein [Christensenellaceae bacterium]|jgi:nitroreductase|nr:nitroreductase family protein [Christensenellaceae bacterium]
MNNTLTVIEKRSSCRNFSNRSISDADLFSISKAALQAPSAFNQQKWHISIVKNKALLDEIEAEGLMVLSSLSDKSTFERIKKRGGKMFYNAEVVSFISIMESTDSHYKRYSLIDLGIIAQNISLACTSLGIDNCHCGMITFCFSTDKKEEFKKKLKIPNGYECSYGVLLGYGVTATTPHNIDESKVSFID